MPSFAIREATPDDLDAVVAFNAAMATETENLTLDMTVLRPGVKAVLAAQALCRDDPSADPQDARGRYWVAVGSSGVAVACLMITHEWSDWRNASRELGVAEETPRRQHAPPRAPTAPRPPCPYSPQGWCWWIQSVYVEPSSRRQGLFTALYRHVEEEAKRAKAAGLRLYVDRANERAVATYRRMGMTSHYDLYENMFA